MTKRLSKEPLFQSCCSGDISEADYEIIYQVSKALGNEARLEIYRFLKKQKSCMTSQLVDYLPLAQSTISQHLKVLKEAGVIVGEIAGPSTNYCINEQRMKQYARLIQRFL